MEIPFKIIEIPDFKQITEDAENGIKYKHKNEVPMKKIKFFHSLKNERLKEEGETFEEYKIRLKVIKDKKYKHGKTTI